jgi:glutathione synthase/RimK-type ligase-like ATP-grasp enzyme
VPEVAGVSSILMTMAEEKETTRDDHFGVKLAVDEGDCYDFSDALQALGHDVFFANWDDLDLDARAFKRMFHDNAKRFIAPVSLSEMDLIFVYKMEGFYFDLPRFFRMVQTFAEAAPLVVNDPATIRHNIDKRYLVELERKGILVPPTQLLNDSVRERLARGEAFVLKPISGERSKGVALIKSPDELAAVEGHEDEYLAQDFIPGISAGERSLVFLGYEYQHAVLKRPSNSQEFRCNESLGGTVATYEPTAAEKNFALRTLRAYESFGCPIHYSRIDLIQSDRGPMLMEAELINPSMYARYSNRGVEFGQKIAAYFDNLLKQQH